MAALCGRSGRLTARFGGVRRGQKRVLTTAIISSGTAVAFMVDDLGGVVELIGAVGGCYTGFFAPCLCYTMYFYKDRPVRPAPRDTRHAWPVLVSRTAPGGSLTPSTATFGEMYQS